MEVRDVFSKTGVKSPVGGKSRTERQHANALDINAIVAKAKRTGMAPINQGAPIYGDFTNITDYHTAHNQILQAQREFMALPPQIRARFRNNPGLLIDFLSNESNREEAVKLGLIPEKAPKISENTPSTPAASTPTA